jgi:hypothetical protein
MGRSAFALANTTEVCVTFDEIDPDTGLIFEEIFSFSKARAWPCNADAPIRLLACWPFSVQTPPVGC